MYRFLETAEGKERKQCVDQIAAKENDDGRHDGTVDEHADELLKRRGWQHGKTHALAREVGFTEDLFGHQHHGQGRPNA